MDNNENIAMIEDLLNDLAIPTKKGIAEYSTFGRICEALRQASTGELSRDKLIEEGVFSKNATEA